MSTHKHIDKICAVVLVLTLAVTLLFMNGAALGLVAADRVIGYENRLFDTSRVHTVDIVMDGWDSFIDTCENEEYAVCAVVIDGESYKNVGIRAKGNTSLRTVSSMNSDRYSFKIKFDHYDGTKSYHGLDKLCLNNLIQDTTYMKDYLTYQLMGSFGADAPLCSYVYITVNGEDWGLYLAVEGVEESFLQRSYGSNYGDLYKPDSMGFGGGRGNGRNFNMEDFFNSFDEDSDTEGFSGFGNFGGFGNMERFAAPFNEQGENQPQDGRDPSNMFGGGMPNIPGEPPQDFDPSQRFGNGEEPDGNRAGGFDRNMFGGGMGSSDVKLQYIDDDPDSYSSIFSSAKTDITNADKSRLIESLKKLSEGEDIESVVDIDEVLRYAVVHNFVVNGDSYTGSMVHNYYLYEENGRLSMIPWDYNLAFGTFQGNNASNAVNDPIDTPLSVTGNGDRPIIDWIFSSEEYTELYHQYFAEFLNATDFAAMIDMTAELIAPYVEKDATAFYSYDEFETGVAALRKFCLLREESIQGQLSGSIPSTNEGQSADSAALVDTAALSLSDMGTMNMGGIGFGMGGNRGGNRSDTNIENFSGGRAGGFGGPEGDRTDSETQNGESEAPSDNGTSDAGTEGNPMQERSQMGGISPGERSASSSPTGGDQRQGQLPPGGMPSGEPDTDAALSEGDDTMQRFPRGMQMPGNFGGNMDDSTNNNRPAGNPFQNMNGAPPQQDGSAATLLVVSAVILLAC